MINTFNFTTPKGTDFTITAVPRDDGMQFVLKSDISPTFGMIAMGLHGEEFVLIAAPLDDAHEVIYDQHMSVIVVPMTDMLRLLKYFGEQLDPTVDQFMQFMPMVWPYGEPIKILTKEETA